MASRAYMPSDLLSRLSASDRERPLVTMADGTLMARHQVISSVGHPSGPLLSAACLAAEREASKSLLENLGGLRS